MKWPARLAQGVIFVGLAVLCSCGTVDYPGTYVGHHPFGVDTLILRPDFTYFHSFRTPEGRRYNHQGRWSEWSIKEFDRIDVENFDWHLPGFKGGSARDTINSSWPAKLERRSWNEQCIWLDEDLGYYYLKIK